MTNNWLDAVRNMGLDIMLAVILTLVAIDVAGRLVHWWQEQAVERRLERDGRDQTGATNARVARADIRTAGPEWMAAWLGNNAAKDAPASGSEHDRHADHPSRRVA